MPWNVQPVTRLHMAVLLLGTVWPIPRAVAQDPFEIEVYAPETAPRSKWELETHLNYIARGTTAFDGSVAPSEHQVPLSFDFTRGLTDHWEVTAYLLSAYRPGSGVERSEEHTSELQSQSNLVCRLLLEKKKTKRTRN